MGTHDGAGATIVGLVLVAVALTSCGSGSTPQTVTVPTQSASGRPTPGGSASGAPSASATGGPTPTGTPTTSPSAGADDCVATTLAGMDLDERVGQLFMVGFDSGGSPAAALSAVKQQHVGSVTMIGRNYDGTAAVRLITDRLQRAAAVPLFVATDQEGGQVQVLQGPGFPAMPSAEDQGALPVAELEARAKTWGRALARAGVNVDLAPVLDVVPASIGTANQPIGRYDRQFGSTAPVVAAHGMAVVRGLEEAGITPVVKHFPGLGSVTGNPDVASTVVDSTTTTHSASLDPFRTAVDQGVPMVMVSSARYEHLDDEHVAMFSSDVVTGLLREDLGFRGVVVTDAIGSAAAVQAVAPVPARAVRFLLAGGDLILTTRAQDVAPMADAVIERAEAHPSFAALVDASVTRVLTAKEDAGLLFCSTR